MNPTARSRSGAGTYPSAAASAALRLQRAPRVLPALLAAFGMTLPAIGIVVLSAGHAAAASVYPDRPIRLVIPFAPGGSNDIVGRLIGSQLGERLGQPVIIDNRGGAGGVIGSELVARASPDGYTLLIVSVAFAFNPALYKLSYDSIKSFAPIGMIGSGPNVLVVNPKLPVNSVKELIEYARANPGKLNLASAGIGSFQHLSGELFNRMAKIDMTHVPFKGGGPAMTDVMSGQSQVTIGSLIQMQGHIRAGRLKPLGVGSLKRNPTLPDVPSISESALPGYEAANWWGVIAPAGTPMAIINRLNKELNASIESPTVQKFLAAEGAVPMPTTPGEFAKVIANDIARWGKVVRDAGIKAE